VHGPQMMTSVFDLTIYTTYVGISADLRKIRASSAI
jgi:hypothetical protein